MNYIKVKMFGGLRKFDNLTINNSMKIYIKMDTSYNIRKINKNANKWAVQEVLVYIIILSIISSAHFPKIFQMIARKTNNHRNEQTLSKQNDKVNLKL